MLAGDAASPTIFTSSARFPTLQCCWHPQGHVAERESDVALTNALSIGRDDDRPDPETSPRSSAIVRLVVTCRNGGDGFGHQLPYPLACVVRGLDRGPRLLFCGFRGFSYSDSGRFRTAIPGVFVHA